MSSYCKLWLLAGLGASLSVAAFGQAGGNPRSGRTPAVVPPPRIQGPDRLSRVITLTGNVRVDDGSPLPEPVTIERICNGRITRDGHTDLKGYFSITFGQNSLADSETTAETSGAGGFNPATGRVSPTSMAQNVLPGCELRGALAGFRSSNVLIPIENINSGVGVIAVGSILLERIQKVPGATVSATNLSAPKDAKKAYDKGHRALQNNKLPEAQQSLEQAVQQYPQYASAWLDLGWVYHQQGQFDKAHEAFTQARTADGMFVPAYVGLASVAVRQSKWAEAAESSAHATQLDGVSFPAAFFYNSLANYQLGNLEQAEKSARKAETLGAQRAFPQLNLLLGMMLAKRHEYADAADQLRAYLKAAPTASNADKVRQQLAELEKSGGAEAKTESAATAK